MSDVRTSTSTDSDRLAATLRDVWGYDGFRPLQQEAMTAVLGGRDSLVVLPTGGGKSLCFQAPALCLDGTAVVVSPLLSLMKDQVDTLVANGVRAACLNSMLTPGERHETTRALRGGELKLLYIAPERLISDYVFDLLDAANVSFFAIDEAHCVSTWGHDFRPHYRQLRDLKERFPNVAVHAYTATATERVRDDIALQLGLFDPEVLVGSFDRPNLSYAVHRASGLREQIAGVVDRHRGESGIVYALSRKKVEEIAAQLNHAGHSALPYHAGLSDDERKANQDAFVEDRVHTIVATVAFGMGIDKPDVRYVVHAGMPKSLENYQQESGRAGRDGLEAECVLFHSGGDIVLWKKMLQQNPRESQAGASASLEAMNDFCNGAACRHRAIVRHFGQDLAEDCGNACDVCNGAVDLVEDALVVGQKILSSVHRQEQRFGAGHTALVLKGSKDKKVLQNGHDQLSTYGLLADESQQTILDWIGQLVQQGFLARVGEYNVLQLTESGGELLRGNETPRLLKPVEKKSASKSKAAVDSWEGVDTDLFEVLRELRAEFASDAGVPPYVVFGDVSLRDMARRRPTSPEAFLDIYGVGHEKAKRYGERFVETIVSHCETTGLSTDVGVEQRSTTPPPEKNAPSGSALRAFPLFDEGRSVAEVAEEFGRAHSTVRGYHTEYLRHRGVTDPSPWVERDVVAEIEAAIDEVGPNPLRPIHEHLEGRHDYESIRTVAVCWENRREASGG